MDWLIDLARTNFVPPWLLHGPIVAFLVSMFFPVFGVVLLIRGIMEHKLYLTLYLGFWLGEGVCLAAIQTLGSIILDGQTPNAFYTELWFYVVLFVPIFVVSIIGLRRIAKDAEKQNRPKEVSDSPSEKYHLNFGFPLGICLTVLVVICAVFLGGPLWVYPAGIAVFVIWFYAVIIVDGKKAVPQTMQQWYGKVILGVLLLSLCAPAAFSFVT